jgi:SAGA-associated factor 11
MELVDDVCLDVCFEAHKNWKAGLLCLNCDSVYSGNHIFEVMPLISLIDVINKPNCDVFGQTANEIQNTESFECLNCKRTVAATRYAPHLEKCMGMGRNSSRIASQR